MAADDPKPSETSGGVPAGLALFRAGEDPARTRRRKVFLVAYVVVASLVLWPVYPLFSGVEPLVLGLPLSFAWVVLALALMFFILLWLFLTEERDARD